MRRTCNVSLWHRELKRDAIRPKRLDRHCDHGAGSQGARSLCAIDDTDKDRLLREEFKPGAKVEISRFIGLGEMPPSALKRSHHRPSQAHTAQSGGAAGTSSGDESIGGKLDGRQARAAVSIHPGARPNSRGGRRLS